jgi:hypothetical protein
MGIGYTVRKVNEFPVPSLDVTNQTLSIGGNNFITRPKRVLLQCNYCGFIADLLKTLPMGPWFDNLEKKKQQRQQKTFPKRLVYYRYHRDLLTFLLKIQRDFAAIVCRFAPNTLPANLYMELRLIRICFSHTKLLSKTNIFAKSAIKSHAIKLFCTEMVRLFSHVADTFCLFSKKLKEKSTFVNDRIFSQAFSRKYEKDFCEQFCANAKVKFFVSNPYM